MAAKAEKAKTVRHQRLGWAAIGGYVIASAGLVSIIARVLFLSIEQPFGTITDAALLFMTLGLAPVMVGAYELGGRTPLLPARAALATGLAAIVAWAVVQAAMIVGAVSFNYDSPASGAFALAAILQILIGAWLVGAPLLAGAWLPMVPRAIGVLSGIGWILLGVGTLLGGVNHPLTYLGGIGYQLLFPIWGLLIAGVYRSEATG